jgi:peptide/nickel transport system ATP-binding protein
VAEHILEVTGLSVEFHTVYGRVQAVKDVSFHLDRGETLAILGESGSGKSVSASAVMNLIDSPPGYITAGEIRYRGESLIGMDAEKRRQINGRKIAMIFQDPLAHLNPVYTVGWQIAETLTTHGVAGDDARARALELMERVGIVDARARMKQYPHQFSGGQRQRLMIAMALALKPDILIADEPTGNLDADLSHDIMELFELFNQVGVTVVIATHDLDLLRSFGHRCITLRAGQVDAEQELVE